MKATRSFVLLLLALLSTGVWAAADYTTFLTAARGFTEVTNVDAMIGDADYYYILTSAENNSLIVGVGRYESKPGKSIRRATKPLAFLSESAQEVAKGNFDAPLPTFKHNDEVAQLRHSFGTMPKTFPAFPERKDLDLYASLTPAKAVGGDLYDFFIRPTSPSSPLGGGIPTPDSSPLGGGIPTPDSSPLGGGRQEGGKLFFCIGDVSGKGVPASLVMAVSRTLFRNIAAHTDKPSHIVETMNANICEGNDNCMFVTLFVGVLDLATGRLRYCNAGHEAPYIQDTLLPCDSNIPIGLTQDYKYTEQETEVAPETTLFLYTDGLTEAMNASRAHHARLQT